MIISSNPIAAAWPESNQFWRDKRAVVTGGSSPYQKPETPELVIESDQVSAEDASGGDYGGARDYRKLTANRLRSAFATGQVFHRDQPNAAVYTLKFEVKAV